MDGCGSPGELKKYRQMRSPEARINTLWTRENDSNIYKMGSPQTKVRLDNGSKVLVLLHTGAEVNVMDKNLQLASNFAMIMDLKL